MYDDPDSDWLCFQKLHAKLPASAITLPSSSPLVPALFPTKEEQEADESIDLPPLEEDETVWSLAWAPGGEYLASGGDSGGIRLWSRQ
jgi:WD40 repeat protein